MGTAGIKITVRGLLTSGDEWRNVFYYSGASDFTDLTIQNWITDVYTPILPQLGDTWTIYGADVAVRLTTYMDTDPLGWGAATFVAKALTGSGGSDNLPPADVMVVLGQTGVKHVLGKKYISCIKELTQANGILSAGAVTALQSFGSKWRAPTSNPLGTPGTACVWGPTHGFVPIIATKADTHIYHLRSRMQGIGV